MWIADLQRLVWLGLVCLSCCSRAYYYHGPSSKQEYIKWREREKYGSISGDRRTQVVTTPVISTTSENDIYYGNLKLRHHSRYPKLDRVMSKIDTMQTTPPVLNNNNNNNVNDNNSNSKKSSGSSSVVLHNRVRHEGWNAKNSYTTTTTTTTDEGLFGEDYDNMEYEDDESNNDDLNEYDDDDDWEDEEDDDNFDEYDDETSDDDNDPFPEDDAKADNAWQAEEATEPPAAPTVSSMTKYKWDNYGTRSRVEESRRQQLNLKPNNEQKGTSAVIDHYLKIRLEGQCRRPLPKVIPVQSEHPDASKTYTPHCTILHRCAEDTGCCASYETRCGPKKQVPVHLYFYTKTLGVTETKVERLTFYNHTECACLEKSKIATSTPTATYLEDSSSSNINSAGLSVRSASYRDSLRPENMRRCRCPELFIPRFRHDLRCTCDCEESDEACLNMKKGHEHVSLSDRRCIQQNKCELPVCEYGIYLRDIGRCQKKEEKMNSYRKLRIRNY